jgi:hypothetical protein
MNTWQQPDAPSPDWESISSANLNRIFTSHGDHWRAQNRQISFDFDLEVEAGSGPERVAKLHGDLAVDCNESQVSESDLGKLGEEAQRKADHTQAIREVVAKFLGTSNVSEVGPPLAPKFLMLLIPPKNREAIIGDLEEEYRTILLREYGKRLANFYYWWHAILACGWSTLGAVANLAKMFIRN